MEYPGYDFNDLDIELSLDALSDDDSDDDEPCEDCGLIGEHTPDCPHSDDDVDVEEDDDEDDK